MFKQKLTLLGMISFFDKIGLKFRFKSTQIVMLIRPEMTRPHQCCLDIISRGIQDQQTCLVAISNKLYCIACISSH